jgi:hypothetical protein
MLQGFWGGVIVCLVDQTIVFLVLGGLALAILAVRRLLQIAERPQPAPAAAPPAPPVAPPGAAGRGAGPSRAQLAAIVAAVQAATAAPQGAVRIVAIAPLGAADPWKMAGRLEAMGPQADDAGRAR